MAIEADDTGSLIYAFRVFRDRLWNVTEVATDASAYELSWTTINRSGRHRLVMAPH